MKNLQYRWTMVALLTAVATINYADRTAISSVFPLLRSDLGSSDVALAAIGSFFLWTYAISSPVWGYLADRVSRSRMIFWSLAMWSLVTLATAFVRSTDQLLATRILLGIAESAYLPASLALIADYHQRDSRGTAIGFHLAGLNLGLVVGGVGAGYVGEHYGWRLSFLLLGSIGLAFAALVRLFLHDAPVTVPRVSEAAGSRTGWRDVLAVIRIPSYLILVAEAMLQAIGLWTFFNWLPLYFTETFHMSLAGSGFSGTFMLQVAAVVGITLGGYVSDKVAGRHSARRMLVMSVCYLIAAPFLLAFGGNPGYLWVSLCIFLYSLFVTLGQANESPLICDLLPPRLRSTAFGLWNMANCTTGGVGILVTGYLKSDYGLGGIFHYLAGLVLLAACLTLIGYLLFLRRDLERSSLRLAQKIPVSA